MLTEEEKREMEEQATLDLVLNTVNSISLAGAIMVMIAVSTSSYFKCNAAKRLSFRLSMWVAFADAIFCCMSYLAVDPLERVLECNIVNAVGYIANLTFIFLTAGMAYNLQMVFVRQQHNPRMTERFYVLTSFLASVVIIAPFTVIAIAMNECTVFPLLGLPYNLVVFWLMIGLWEVVAVAYCAITIIKVVLKLTRFHEDILTLQQGGASPTVDRISDSIQSRVEQVVRRLIFYPLIPVLTQTTYVITSNFSLINGGKTNIERYIYYVPSYSAGLLNAIVFLFDPALPEIWYDFRQFLIRKYYLQPLSKGELNESNWFSRKRNDIVYNLFVKDSIDEDGFRLSKASQSFFHNGLILVPPEIALQQQSTINRSNNHLETTPTIASSAQILSDLHLRSNSSSSVKLPLRSGGLHHANLSQTYVSAQSSQFDLPVRPASCAGSPMLAGRSPLSRESSTKTAHRIEPIVSNDIDNESLFSAGFSSRNRLVNYHDATSIRSRTSFYSTNSTKDMPENQVTLLL